MCEDADVCSQEGASPKRNKARIFQVKRNSVHKNYDYTYFYIRTNGHLEILIYKNAHME